MTYAKKMVLVEPRQIEKYKESMLDKALTKLDGEMYEILHRNVPDDEKAKHYSNSLRRYMNIDKSDVVTKFDSDDSKEETKPDDSKKRTTEIQALVLDSVPKKWKSQASRLLTHIENNPDVGWNEKGELVLKDTAIPKTHIVDLVNDLMRKRTTSRDPNGWRRLADALKDHNIPRELIGNEDRWSYINDTSNYVESVTPNVRQRSGIYRTLTPSNGSKRQRKQLKWELY